MRVIYYFSLAIIILTSTALLAAAVIILGILMAFFTDSSAHSSLSTYAILILISSAVGPGTYPIFFGMGLALTGINLKQGEKAKALAWQLLPLGTIAVSGVAFIVFFIISSIVNLLH